MRGLMWMGIAMAGLLSFTAGGSAADEKIDAKKLVGKWEPKEQKDVKTVMEFTRDGKLTVYAASGDMEFSVTGTWELKDSTLTILLKAGENEIKDKISISKLTDDELIGESETKKQKETFKRVK